MVDVRLGASEEYVGIIEVEIHPAIVVWHGGATCIGVICREDVSGIQTKSVVSLFALAILNPAAIPVVLAMFFALAIPCQSRGLGWPL